MKTSNNRKSSIESNYDVIKRIILTTAVDANEEEGTLIYKNEQYYLNYFLTDNDFECEFMIDGEYVELEEPETDLLFTAVENEIENERINARHNVYEEPYFYLTHNQ